MRVEGCAAHAILAALLIRLDSLPSPQRRAIETIREVASEKNYVPYLVGGPVRDLLLGRSVIDLDFTLEEGSSELARAVARRINGRLRSYPQFLTYKVVAPEFPVIDIATARSEKYRAPGALPSVSAGRLQDDLLRRDFSINAIALNVLSESLHDPAGGKEDLERKAIRVLHDDSFVDDPTRIYRAIRLATRLGFTIEAHTQELMRNSIRNGALRAVSKERLWRELFLAFEEENAPEVIEALNDAGALEVLFGPRKIDRVRVERALKIAKADPSLDREVLFISAILYGNASPVDLEGSGFSQRRARNIMQIANEIARYTDGLTEAATERQRFRLLKHASPELLAVLPAEHVARFNDYRNFRLALRGSELEVPSGPHIARALELTREAVFMGEITPDEARNFARRIAIKYLNREQVSDIK
jgi:tRNA nucleotidyltransferase (CCA-adding enzyme)